MHLERKRQSGRQRVNVSINAGLLLFGTSLH